MTWTRRFLQSPPVRLLLFAAFTLLVWLLYLAHRRGRIRPPVWVKRADSFLARKVMGA